MTRTRILKASPEYWLQTSQDPTLTPTACIHPAVGFTFPCSETTVHQRPGKDRQGGRAAHPHAGRLQKRHATAVSGGGGTPVAEAPLGPQRRLPFLNP